MLVQFLYLTAFVTRTFCAESEVEDSETSLLPIEDDVEYELPEAVSPNS